MGGLISDEKTMELDAARLLDDYIHLASKCLTWMKGFHVRSPSDHAHRIIASGLFAKAFCTARAIRTLVEAGLIGDAAILLRSLLELAVTLLYIGRSPQTRAELYLNYQHVARKHLHDAMRKHQQ